MLKFLTAGESHGPSLTAILEGMPAGVPLSSALIDKDLLRRQQGFGSGGRMKIERDHARITGGVMNGRTTGAPISFVVENLDHAKWKDRDIEPMTIPRPGHADLTGAVKYGYRELRLSLERASARETTMRVAVGAACRALLSHFGIVVGGYVVSVGNVTTDDRQTTTSDADNVHRPLPTVDYLQRFAAAEANDVRCYDEATSEKMREKIRAIIEAKDTLGGVIECVALNAPPGLGSHVHWDRRLSAKLAAAVMSIHAMKGVEIGDGFAETLLPGTQVQDQLFIEGDEIKARTNHAGGLEGGITNGQPIVVRAALKPIATTLNPLDSVDLAAGEEVKTKYERSDFCQAPRAVPIVEAMMCFVLADALLEKLGGDSLDEMRSRFDTLRKMRLSDLPMDNAAWRFGFE
jgi:chorismate synthase